MSSSNIKNFMKKFNVSKPTDMPDIPEEKLGPDGRPLSMVSQAGKGHTKRSSVTSTVSELSTATTHVPSGLGIKDLEKDTRAADMVTIPEDVQTPTDFGPDNKYKAVPSIIEYSTSRGRSRVSIREATPEEAKKAAGSHMPIISDIPELSHLSAATGMPVSNIVPRIAPPPNFEPVQGDGVQPSTLQAHPALSSHPLRHPRTSHADSMRTSTTSIRTSTTSDPRTSIATTEGDQISERGSLASTLNPPGSPPQILGPSPEYQKYEFLDKAPSSTGSWPLHHQSLKTRGHNSIDTSGSDRSPSIPDSYEANQSRFSWHVSKTEKASNWFTRWFIEWWAMEIASWCFSAVCMMIIIIMLWKVDGEELPKWKLGISINAFISVFSGFAKSALLLPTAEALGQLKWSWFTSGKERRMMDFEVIDSASRGPWGSMLMLGKTKGISLASVGAAIILLSLPLDLFFQQIIAYPSTFRVDQFSNATISRVIDYDPGEEKQWRGTDGWQIKEDSQLSMILYPYWQAQGVVPDVQFDCPTGNCTYDPFETLAFDFQCASLPSDMLQFSCQNAPAEWLSYIAVGFDETPNVTACGWYLNVPESTPQLMSGYEVYDNGTRGETLATRFYALSDIMTNQLYFGGSVNFKNISNPVTDFIMASTPGGFDGAHTNNTPVMQECEIHWVVKRLQSRVVDNVLFEEQLETWQFENYWETSWHPDDLNWYQPNFTMVLPDIHSVTGETSKYFVDNTTARKVWQSWAHISSSTFIRPNASAEYGDSFKIVWLNASPGTPHLADMATPLPWDFPRNATAHMAEAVLAMNQVARHNTLSRTQRHDVSVGVAYKNVVFVDVRWQWITLPVALLLFALLFLLATMYRSAKDKEQIGVWKTSALAVLFNGLGDDVQGFVGSGNKKQGYVRRKARDIKVQLDDD